MAHKTQNDVVLLSNKAVALHKQYLDLSTLYFYIFTTFIEIYITVTKTAIYLTQVYYFAVISEFFTLGHFKSGKNVDQNTI